MPAKNRPRRQFRISMIVLVVFAILSTSGFYLFGNLDADDRTLLQAIYITANIFSTVGNWTESLNVWDKLWEIIVIFFGIGAAAYALGSVTALITSGEIQRTFGRRSQVDKIKEMSGHYIVCGFGRMGQSICEELHRDHVPFVLVEMHDEATAKADEAGYVYLLGDATEEQALQTAGIERAAGLVATLPHDADNVFVVLTAREMNSEMKIIARAERAQTEGRLLRAGATRVICPPVIGALKITRMLLRPAVEEFLEATTSRDMSVDKIDVSQMAGLMGKSLRDLGLPKKYGVMVVAVESNGERMFSPPADHVLAEGDQLVVIGSRDSVDTMLAKTGRIS